MKKSPFVFVLLLIFALPAISSADPPGPGPNGTILPDASFSANTPMPPYLVRLSETLRTDSRSGDSGLSYRSEKALGFAYKVGNTMEIILHYGLSQDQASRYIGTGKAPFDRSSFTATNLRLDSQNASVGFRIRF